MRAILATVLFGIAIVFVGSSTARATIYLASPSPARNDRFYEPGTGDPAKAFLGAAYDWSGVGLTSNANSAPHWVTMISDTYFLSAAHWFPSGTVEFYPGDDPAATPVTRTIVSGEVLPGGDLYLGRLDSAVPSTVAKYPVLGLYDASGIDATKYYGQEIWTYGLSTDYGSATATSMRLGRNNIDHDGIGLATVGGTTGVAAEYTYNTHGALGGDESYLIVGDSGGPSFAIYNGQPVLVGVHWYNTGTSAPSNGAFSGDTFVPAYIDTVRSHMQGGETLAVVPEPATAVLALVSFGLWTCGRTLRGRRRISARPKAATRD